MNGFFSRPWTVQHLCIGVFAFAFLLYLPHIGNGFIGVDDPRLITGNPLVLEPSMENALRAFTSFPLLLYIPLATLSYQLNVLIAGIQPWIFHLTDAVLHGLCAALAAIVALRLTKNFFPALIVGLLFAAHPLQAEAVLWASSRKDLLSTAFALGSMILYLRSIDTDSTSARWWSVALYVLGLLAKVAIFPLPIVFLLLDVMRGRRLGISLLTEKWPFAIAAAALITVGVYGSSPFLSTLEMGTMLLLAAKGTGYLLLSFLWPATLSLLHEQPEPIIADPLTILGLMALLVIAGVIAWSLWKKKISVYVFGLGFFLLLLAPTFLAAQKAGVLFFTSDKYAYLPSLGIFLIAGVLLDRLRTLYPRMHVAYVLLAAIVLEFSITTTLYARRWTNSSTLYQSILENDPRNTVALNNLGLILLNEERKPQEAFEMFGSAMHLAPSYIPARINAASALEMQGKRSEMLQLYRDITPVLTRRQVLGDPALRRALLSIAEGLAVAGSRDDALTLLRRLADLAPEDGDVHAALGEMLIQAGEEANGIQELERAAELSTKSVTVYFRLAELYSRQNRVDDVIRMLERAFAIDPNNGTVKQELMIFRSLRDSSQ